MIDPKKVSAPAGFAEAHAGLRKILQPYTKMKGMKVLKDGPEGCIVLAPPSPKHTQYPDGLWFAATRVGKAYVSFHLMPIYMCPELAKRISPAPEEEDAGQDLLQLQGRGRGALRGACGPHEGGTRPLEEGRPRLTKVYDRAYLRD